MGDKDLPGGVYGYFSDSMTFEEMEKILRMPCLPWRRIGRSCAPARAAAM